MSYIYIQDNFFEKNIFKEIKNKINTYSYSPPPLKRIKDYGGCYWFEHNLPRGCDVQKVVIKTLQEKMNLSVDEDFKSDDTDVVECESKFIMPNAQDGARPHVDPCQLQCLVFIKGEEIIKNGTLFFDDAQVGKDKKFNINTHVGFKENRGIVFSSNNLHAPAQFSGGSWRYCLANFFHLKNN